MTIQANKIQTEFLNYFSEWRHAKLLIGTCTCWFFLDIAYVPSVKICDSTDKYIYLCPVSMVLTLTKTWSSSKSASPAKRAQHGSGCSKSALETSSLLPSVSCPVSTYQQLAVSCKSILTCGRILCDSVDHREAWTQMDPDSRFPASCFIPSVVFLLHLYFWNASDKNVVAILASRFHSLNNAAFVVNFTLLQVCKTMSY
jgi:hypothetical protein